MKALPIICNLLIPFVRMVLKPSSDYENELKTTLEMPVNGRPPSFIESQSRFAKLFFLVRRFFIRSENFESLQQLNQIGKFGFSHLCLRNL